MSCPLEIGDRPAVAEATAATLARLHTENAALHQRVGELERLVGALKGRLRPRPPAL